VIFIETSIFTKTITSLLPDESYKSLQVELLRRPDSGAIIKGSGGLRKIRWSIDGSGKRGGIRVIYYYDHPNRVFMLLAYKKNFQENLTPAQTKVLRRVVEEWLL
jgi:hypothetical protein